MKKTNAFVTYDKFYVDDTGKHINNFLGKDKIDQLNIKEYWGHTIDAFYNFNCQLSFTCLAGDLRIILAYENTQDNEKEYNFTQYYVSALDGKIITILPNNWFGIQNLLSEKGMILNKFNGTDFDFQKINNNIFNWDLNN